MREFVFSPIGFVRGGADYSQQAPRQGVFARNCGEIELLPDRNFETALEDLAAFERIWVVFVFDRNSGWKPKVCPPLGGFDRKVGVFASRSPHRPNPVGISAVRLLGVEGRVIRIADFDLLNGTPVLDIKPYIPTADAFPAAAAGWRDEVAEPRRRLVIKECAAEAMEFVLAQGGPDLVGAARTQLVTRDLDPARQRLTLSENGGTLAFRTWRIDFELTETSVTVVGVRSGYTGADLQGDAPDPYHDKELHRIFIRHTLE
ncbi:MAG: tRNA (N6-threonylcarbamoyladenosine(37)-N6)-methyltransferase TrmO [Victivallaceae bacterium]|nr:tRNA (N6-threonylcarbamoyladenosine(37)-N6)-methyltransferase TrmO [Victivallaceae bacterium]